MECKCWRIISRTCRNGHAVVSRCPHSLDSQDIIGVSALTNCMNSMKAAFKFKWSEYMEKDLKN